MKKNKYRTPKKIDDIVLEFGDSVTKHESAVFERHLRFAYRAVEEIMALTVEDLFGECQKREHVCARRFIVIILAERNSWASLKLLGSAIGKKHCQAHHLMSLEKGERANLFYEANKTLLEKAFFRIVVAEDFDLVDTGRMYSAKDLQRIMYKITGVRLKVKLSRRARRAKKLKRGK
jgi:hypothetical protein